ncbi:hypothetical protein EV702DRAFT_1138902 [Suillus placidus]|uniref:Secreted protein n=1 Tax=Suillus placidus TaxID=48579 RepID=A0A9P7CYF6_9AGAM|nr:hypothetical protein EV702DRAFT_1138902 [Suillus placidus]
MHKVIDLAVLFVELVNCAPLDHAICWPLPFTAPSLDSHYTSNVHTTPPLQHLPAPPQPAPVNHPQPNEARGQRFLCPLGL